MAAVLKWQEELIAIAWINIALIVMSFPLFSIYIVESLQGENVESFVMHTERGQHFLEIIAKYFASIMFWIPMSIMLKIGATKPSFNLLKTCSVGNLVFIFLLALQLIVEPPESILVVCAYAICFIYLLSTLWIMKSFADNLALGKGELTPTMNSTLNSDTISNTNSNDNFDELNDVADQRTVFRLHQLSRITASTRTKL